MAYKHILIAVDLSPESKVLVEKAVSMAPPLQCESFSDPRRCKLL